MAKQFTYKSYKNTFRTIHEVMDHMLELHKELYNSDLHNLTYFNITYFIITKNVFALSGKNYFSDDQTVKKLDINFAGYYFEALRMYIYTKETTPAWRTMFDFCKQETSIPLIYLALGVNAHVNNDLGLSLFDIVKKSHFKSDFDKVNPIIFNSLNEVIDATKLNPFYKPFMKQLIYRWRHNAWKNYMNIKEIKTSKENIELNANKIALDLIRIRTKKDFYHIPKVW